MICTVSPALTVDSLPIPRCTVILPDNADPAKVIPLLKFKTTVSHEPIILPRHREAVANYRTTLEEIVLNQRMIDQGEWYVDDFGFYVYCLTEVSTENSIIDLRYTLTLIDEIPSRDCTRVNSLPTHDIRQVSRMD